MDGQRMNIRAALVVGAATTTATMRTAKVDVMAKLAAPSLHYNSGSDYCYDDALCCDYRGVKSHQQ